jgi:hypothetical protein
MTPLVVYTCALESQPSSIEQAHRLLCSLRWFGGAQSQAPFLVGALGTLPPPALEALRGQGACVVPLERFDARHGPSNKIALLARPELAAADVVVLLDCDTLILRDPSAWLAYEGIAAKPTDVPSVGLELLARLFAHYAVAFPEAKYQNDVTGDATIPYVNSGVVIVAQAWRPKIAEAWRAYGRRIIDDGERLGCPLYFSDQVSLALAIASQAVPFSALPTEMNMPVHLNPQKYPAHFYSIDPTIIHYHWCTDADGYLKRTPFPGANLRIQAFNARLRAERYAGRSPVGTPQTIRSTPKVVVGSGWWRGEQPHQWSIGAPITSSPEFFALWYRQVMLCLSPARIVVTDSASPMVPDWRLFPEIEWVTLDANYGHANDIRSGKIATKYSGFTRSLLHGAMYALCCDADYYVYVEQDCLVRGHDLIAHATAGVASDIIVGAPAEGAAGLGGRRAAGMLQQSLIIARREGVARLIRGLLEVPWTDGEVPPEETMRLRLQPLGTLAIPYGRSRPIDFGRSHYYVQHLTEAELAAFCDREGLSLRDVPP